MGDTCQHGGKDLIIQLSFGTRNKGHKVKVVNNGKGKKVADAITSINKNRCRMLMN